MKKSTLVIAITFVFMTSLAKAEPTCNCKEASNDNLEKLTALAVKGNNTAYQFYLDEFKAKNIRIDPDLEIALDILHNQSPYYWSQIDYLKDRLAYLSHKRETVIGIGIGKKKSPDEYSNVYWVKEKRLGCLQSIINQLISNQSYIDWNKSGKKEKKKQVINDANEKIEKKSSIKENNTDNTKIKQETSTQTNEDVLKQIQKVKEELQKLTNTKDNANLNSEEVVKNELLSDTILFNEGEINLDNKDVVSINSIVQKINNHNLVEIRIEGFASQTGSRETNFAISMSRCYAIKKALQVSGYKGDFSTIPYGETDSKEFRAVVVTLRGK